MPGRRPRIMFAVTGGIAAFKSADAVRLLVRAGCDVQVLMTRTARDFIGAATFAALSGHSVITDDVPPADGSYPHLDAAREVELLIVAPATAATISRLAAGLAEDVLTATYLGYRGTVLVAPAMNVRMYEHPATQRQLSMLRGDGVELLGPDSGLLACGDVGAGRMVEPETLAARALDLVGVSVSTDPVVQLRSDRALAGNTVVITAGGTREPIDSVRDITNRSSGRMGVELARAAAAAGATVNLITTVSVDPALHAGITPSDVVATVAELAVAVEARAVSADVVLMAAAVGDFTVAPGNTGSSDRKLVRGEHVILELQPTRDIVAGLAAARGEQGGAPTPYLVAFAAETAHDGLDRARAKRERKGVDMIVYNDVSDASVGFSSVDNAVTIIDAEGEQHVARAPKAAIAAAIIARVAMRVGQRRGSMLR